MPAVLQTRESAHDRRRRYQRLDALEDAIRLSGHAEHAGGIVGAIVTTRVTEYLRACYRAESSGLACPRKREAA